MTQIASGGCQCGEIRSMLAGDVPPAYACHCGECKRQSACAFSMSVVVSFDRLKVIGTPTSFKTTAFSGAIKTCYFCPKCGTRMWHGSSAAPDIVMLKVGTLDDSASIAPRAHLWVSKKQAGISLDPDAPAFDTQPDNFAKWREGLK